MTEADKNSISSGGIDNPRNGIYVINSFTGHTKNIYDVACVKFKSDGIVRCISVSTDQYIRVYNTATGQQEQPVKNYECCYSIIYDEKRHQVLISQLDGKCHLYEVEPKFRSLKKFQVGRYSTGLCRLIWVADQVAVVCGGWGKSKGELLLLDYSENCAIKPYVKRTIYVNPEQLRCCIQLKSRKNIVVCGGGEIKKKGGVDFRIRFVDWMKGMDKDDFDDGNVVAIATHVHCHNVTSLASFVRNSLTKEEWVISGSYHYMCVWTMHGRLLSRIETRNNEVYSLLQIHRNFFLGGGRRGPNGTVFWIDAEKFYAVLEGIPHKNYVRSMKWIDDEKRELIATCSNDMNVKVLGYKDANIYNQLRRGEKIEVKDEKERVEFIFERMDTDLSDFRIKHTCGSILLNKSMLQFY